MSITCLPHDPISFDILTWYEGGISIPSQAEVATSSPISSCFDDLLGTPLQNPQWASFEAPPGHPSFALFCLGLCPHIDFELVLCRNPPTSGGGKARPESIQKSLTGEESSDLQAEVLQSCLTHPSEPLMALYLFIQQANKDHAYILAKMTLRKA